MLVWGVISYKDLEGQLVIQEMQLHDMEDSQELLKDVIRGELDTASDAQNGAESDLNIEQVNMSIEEMIEQSAKDYGVDVGLAKRIAFAESGYNPNAKNAHSSASGIYQFLSSSWQTYSVKAGMGGADVFDAGSNIKVAMYVLSTVGTSPWISSRSKWSL